ncbi:MipA/OmpV family protein [Oricola cellulosilytica]|uniref:MipA/OmpV family protein n=1 Tax=Oricola cellulosilytica TaxID=1429082 RepID=A0A4R0PHW2_9HYPH|nr:MipA/OmpV family protein [Oricola cellulosilytica]TCD16150.1 MipA/OmpV family protein [Oricola cellulosilytica]
MTHRLPFMHVPRVRLIAVALSTALSVAAGGATADERGPGIEFELGAGALTAPHYEGSSRYRVRPFPLIRFGYLQLPNGFALGGGDGQGLSAAPSFRYRAARKAEDAPELTGLRDVDAAVEIGGGLRYTAGNVRLFGDLRYGAIGHNGITGEIGADMIAAPAERLTVSAGPRLSFADDRYMRTYFGVTAGEAAASPFSAFAPSGGFKSAGVGTAARYQFDDRWALEAEASWNRLIGDAGNSPIVAAGSRDQFSAGIGLVRKFSLGFGD